MRICLIHAPPASEFERHWARFPVLGLAYLAASLEKAGHQVLLLDGKLGGLNEEQIVARALRSAPDLIGFTCMTVEFPAVARMAASIKASLRVPIAIGGAHVNAVGDQALRECPAFDFVCRGEGEDLILELLDALDEGGELGGIEGLSYRAGDDIVSNGPRPYPKDYDRLAFPAWHLFRIGDEIPVLTHRGCPYRCTFCGHNSGFKARFRSVDNVLEEIEGVVHAYRPRVVRFEDETFGLDLKRTKAILAGLIGRGLHERTRFSAQTRVDRIDEDFIRLLRAANFETLELGVETGNPQILRDIRKGITLDQVEYAVALAKQAGLRVWCKFIIGHPNETSATAMDTVRFIARLNPDRLSVSIMTPFPGTPIHEMALRGEGGYRLLSSDWKDFDKYSTGALELRDLPLHKLKLYQLLCYLMLYLGNRRLVELAKLVWGHRLMAMTMLVGPLDSLIRRDFRAARAQG